MLIIFFKALEFPIKYFSENPNGAVQKKQIEFLATYDGQHPNVKYYCFDFDKKIKNMTEEKAWDIPAEWWFVNFGAAFHHFVNHNKTFELAQNTKHCDVIFIFKNGGLSQLKN